MVKVAIPLPFRFPVPRTVKPSRNVTVPVGIPEPGMLAVTVAVKVTDWPNADGLAEDTTVEVVVPWSTACVTIGDVLAMKSTSPP